MKQLTHLFVVLVMGIFVLSMVTGCSDSDSTNSNLQQGDLNEFQNERGFIEQGLSAVGVMFTSAAGHMGGFQPPNVIHGTADTTYYGYDDQSGWWWSYAEESSGYGYLWYGDSVRFSSGGNPQQFPDDDTDKAEMKLGYGYDVENQGTAAEFELAFDIVVTFEDGETGEVWVYNGDGGYYYYIVYQQDEIAQTMVFDYNSLKFSEDFMYGYMPFAGSASTQLQYYDTVNGGYIGFDMTVTYYEDHYHVYVSDGTYYWEWDEYYEG